MNSIPTNWYTFTTTKEGICQHHVIKMWLCLGDENYIVIVRSPSWLKESNTFLERTIFTRHYNRAHLSQQSFPCSQTSFCCLFDQFVLPRTQCAQALFMFFYYVLFVKWCAFNYLVKSARLGEFSWLGKHSTITMFSALHRNKKAKIVLMLLDEFFHSVYLQMLIHVLILQVLI